MNWKAPVDQLGDISINDKQCKESNSGNVCDVGEQRIVLTDFRDMECRASEWEESVIKWGN